MPLPIDERCFGIQGHLFPVMTGFLFISLDINL
ncbi:hypothetical protein CEXT_647291, partial [Caerostris extrusa]